MVMDKHGESSITRKTFQTQIAVWYRNVVASTIILYLSKLLLLYFKRY